MALEQEVSVVNEVRRVQTRRRKAIANMTQRRVKQILLPNYGFSYCRFCHNRRCDTISEHRFIGVFQDKIGGKREDTKDDSYTRIDNAQNCSETCLTCDQENTCTSCKDGYGMHDFVPRCVPCRYNDCLTCANRHRKVCSSCKPGKFGITCTNQCNLGCQNNTCDYGNGTCSCSDGYYGQNCSEKCSEYCSYACDRSNGSCQCKPGYYGDTCQSKCHSGCLDCDNPDNCTLCQVNRHGFLCEKECSQNCVNGCTINDGHCYNCNTRWFGIYCNNSCSLRCANGCESTGKCLRCVLGYYGDICNEPCPSNCKGGCNQTNGVCFDCVTGLEGRFCEVIPDKIVSSPIASLSGVGITGWVIAVLLALVVIIGLALFCRRRSMSAKEVNTNPEGNENSYYNVESMKVAVTCSRPPDSSPDYSCLGDTDFSHTYSALDTDAL